MIPVAWRIPIDVRARLTLAVAAALLVGVAVAAWRMTADRRTCQEVCQARGYADMRLSPAGRDRPARCHCLTADEARVRDRIVPGTEVEMPAR